MNFIIKFNNLSFKYFSLCKIFILLLYILEEKDELVIKSLVCVFYIILYFSIKLN